MRPVSSSEQRHWVPRRSFAHVHRSSSCSVRGGSQGWNSLQPLTGTNQELADGILLFSHKMRIDYILWETSYLR